MSRNFNINILHQHHQYNILQRGELREDYIVPAVKGVMKRTVVPKGTKGWLVCDCGVIKFKFDEMIKIPRSYSLVALTYINNAKKLRKEIKTYKASNEERIEYIVKYINMKRKVKYLGELDPVRIKNRMRLALETPCVDLDDYLRGYLEIYLNLLVHTTPSPGVHTSISVMSGVNE